ncbi:hypothetical protein F8G81_05845 [Arthrobacter sp. CDRTa11]|uniref:iron chaperone n=1 Tax=Arthrobacter sp. CDRTa11 TaxID=2651199 RepID=UPI002265851C|nr:hypothetical protein [Arthrobacter sp. CDRTa11]UZX02192.1 hypothetical protein F8G81_05845 [Arthrobacter sp. CDRTa11]
MNASGSGGFTEVERAAMKERAAELRAEKGGKKAAAALEDLLEKIAEMPDDQRVIAERIHAIVAEAAPALIPKTWYGQPAWANSEGKVVLFFQAAAKFGTRYSTLGVQEAAALDDGNMWPTSWAITQLDTAEEARVAEIVRKAADTELQ